MSDIFDRITIDDSPRGDVFDEIQISESALPVQEITRHLGRTASRIGESVLGLPGDVLRTGQLAARGLEKGAGRIRRTLGMAERETGLRQPGIPGSEELKNLSQKIFGEAVTPQTAGESFVDDIVSDASVLALPIKGKIPFIRAIGTAVAGNVGEEAAKRLGAGQKGQAAAKLGSFFLAGLMGRGNVKKYWNQQYRLAEEALPADAKIDSFLLDSRLRKIERELERGISTPSKNFVKRPLEQIRKKAIRGEVGIDELIEMKKDINELRGSLYKDLTGKQSIRYAQGKINEVANLLDSEIQRYGKGNPKFLSHYKNANDAYAGFNQSRRVGNWIGKQIKTIGKGPILILEGLFRKLIPASGVGFVGLKAGELMTRITRNPTLRRFYSNMMKDALKENSAGFLRNLKSLEKKLKEEEPDIFSRIQEEK